MIYLIRYWKPLAVLVLLAGIFAWGDHKGASRVQARFDKHLLADKAAEAKALAKAREQEQAMAQAQAEIADAYERGKRDAEEAGRRVADDLRSGALRLRRQWQGCVSDSAASRAELDAIAADRAESAGRIVRAAREADDQIKRLQDFILSERK